MARASVRIPLALIEIRDRLRKVDPAKAQVIAESMAEGVQAQPVLLRPIDGEEGEQRYRLVVGATRCAAARLLGWPDIEADIRIMTDAEARLVEIDENLCRDDLSALQRAVFVAARFDAWRSRFPGRVTGEEAGQDQPKRGRPKNSAKIAEFLNGASPTMGFREETAAEVGLSPRTVANAFAVFKGLSPALRERLDGTFVGRKEGLLRQLAAVAEPDEQNRIVEVLLSGQTSNFSAARAIAAGHQPAAKTATPTDETVKAFRKLWAAASPGARGLILGELQ
ncbi:MAG TPA: ParB N-terminal domain-containing protein, partial [Caulobacteraceae bacterium]|nr:ParB N-terminal domain-containing protein [Caulobacteraceae bacterium]